MPGERSRYAIEALKAGERGAVHHETLEAVAHIAVNAIKRRLSRPGSGAVYVRGTVEHRASAPGQPPAVDTGRLRNSIDYVVVGAGGAGGYVDVGTTVIYAPWLEHGTSRMAPRPFMRPAIAEITPQIERIIGEAIVVSERIAVRSMPREVILPPIG